MNIKKFIQKAVSILLCAVLLLTYAPAAIKANALTGGFNKVVDPYSIDDWRQFFLKSDGIFNTENAGGVWTDKSVFADASYFTGKGLNVTMKDPNNFLVGLSAIGSNMAISGMAAYPTDTVLVLDVSDSMNDSNSVDAMIDAANTSIKTLMANPKSRVAVVFYSKTTSTFLPLDHYTTGDDGIYITSDRRVSSIALDSAVRNSSGRKPSTRNVPDASGTYTSLGIYQALDVFESASIDPTDPHKPVVILMTDGAPTRSHTYFSTPGSTSNLGNGQSTNDQIVFTTELTASYVKEKITEIYGKDNECLFYTLGMGVASLTNQYKECILDPLNENTTGINTLWSNYYAATAGSYVLIEGTAGTNNAVYVTKLAANDVTISSNYVNKYFPAATAAQLEATFEQIMNEIALQASYYPTFVSGSDASHSGYISFVDKLGDYMYVENINGLVFNDKLYTGSQMAQYLSEVKLGTVDDPSSVGNNLVWSIAQRLGLSNVAVVQALIQNAFNANQLYYNSDTDFSNYIGWYSDANDVFLGFSDGKGTNVPAGAVYDNRSYIFLGEYNAETDSYDTQTMYATIRVRKNMQTDEEYVAFSLPANLLPTISYTVQLDENGELEKLDVTSATPITLLFEVGLDEDINTFNVLDKVSSEYLNATNSAGNKINQNADGSINFFSDAFDADGKTGYGKNNTYSYFTPSLQNNRYYFRENAMLGTLSGNTFTAYAGATKPTGTGYVYEYTVYEKTATGIKTNKVYIEASSSALSDAVRNPGSGTWYIPEGTPRQQYNEFVLGKTENKTGTVDFVADPMTQYEPNSEDIAQPRYIASISFGNNGKLVLTPETGIKISKELAAGATATTQKFEFTVKNTTNVNDNATHNAMLVAADGTQTTTQVNFNNGSATVSIAPGETLYIGDMNDGEVITVTEKTYSDYAVEQVTVNGAVQNGITATLTTAASKMPEAVFTNRNRGLGSLTVRKEVEHTLGTNYVIPAGKTFTFELTFTLNGEPLVSDALMMGSAPVTLTNGRTTLVLRNGESATIRQIPEGTVVNVTEVNPGDGFTPTYFETETATEVQGDGTVTIADNQTVNVRVANNYAPTPVTPKIDLSVIKHFVGDRVWQVGDSFTFILEKKDTASNAWSEVARATLTVKANDAAIGTNNSITYTFDKAFENEVLSSVGEYTYRVREDKGQTAGVTYDASNIEFVVKVTDVDMDGMLSISSVTTNHPYGKAVEVAEEIWDATATFTNRYNVESAEITLEGIKLLTGATLNADDFSFVLIPTDSTYTNSVGSAVTVKNGADGKLSFGEFTFDATGKYYFKVYEENLGTANIKFDATVYYIEVEVTHDTSVAKLIADYTVYDKIGGTPVSGITFNNVYVQPIDVTIDVNKIFIDTNNANAELGADGFEFLLTENGLPVTNGSSSAISDATGVAQFKLTFDYKDLKIGTFTYVLTERNLGSTAGHGNIRFDASKYTYTVTLSLNQENKLVAAVTSTYDDGTGAIPNPNANNIARFKNEQDVGQVYLDITGTKELVNTVTKQNMTVSAGEFKFELYEAADDWTEGSLLDTVEVKADGDFIFRTRIVDQVGTYRFIVKEVKGNNIRIDYSKDVFYVQFEVTSDSNKLTATKLLYKNGTAATDKIDDNNIIFVNEYTPEPDPVKLILPIQKIVEHNFDPSVQLNLAGFEFKLKMMSGSSPLPTATVDPIITSDASGKAQFELTFTEKQKDKSFKYYIYELSGDDANMSYSNLLYIVTFNVTVDSNNKVNVSYNFNGSDVTVNNGVGTTTDSEFTLPELGFINKRNSQPIDYNLDITKVLTGRELNANEFEFLLYAVGADFSTANVTPTAVMNPLGGAGTDTETFAITVGTFNKPGTYYFVIEENTAVNPGRITFDTSVYYVTINVFLDANEQLDYSVTIKKNSADAANDEAYVQFNNKFTPKPADVPIDITINKDYFGLDGEYLDAKGFTFQVIDITNNGNVLVDTIETTTANGRETFYITVDETFLTAPRTYKIVEVPGNNPNIKYSTAVYEFTVKANLNTKNVLEPYVEVNGVVDYVRIATFENHYFINSYDVALEGTKNLIEYITNAPMAVGNGDYTFDLYRTDSTFAITGLTPKTAVNDANGKFVFDLDTFTREETRYYVLKEYKDTANAIDRVTYDESTYYVTVEVKLGADGKLYETVKYKKDNGAETTMAAGERFEFTNTFVPEPAKITVPVNILKIYTDKNTNAALSPEGFEFLLEKNGLKVTGIAGSDPISDTAGKALFNLEFGENDIGTHTYMLTEVNKGEVNVLYSTRSYEIVITVSLDKATNTLKADITLDGVAVNKIDTTFENVHYIEPIIVNIAGTKVLEGRNTPLAAGEFTFILYRADGSFNIDETVQTEYVTNSADGSFAFNHIEIDKAGTYRYIIEEDLSRKVLKITYDETKYYMQVDVAYNASTGHLEPTVTIRTAPDAASTASDIVFRNVYEPTDISVDIKIQKKLLDDDNKPLTANGFEFELYKGDVKIGDSVFTNNLGQARFDLNYNKTDIGKTYTYTIKEVNTGKPNIIYTTDTFTFTVTLTQVNDEIVATVRQGGKLVVDRTARFTNYFHIEPIEVDITGTKEYKHLFTNEKLAIAEGQFEFMLYKTDATFGVTGITPESVKVKADGTFAFTSEIFTRPETRYYVIKELKGDTAATKIRYDDTVYLVQLDVALDANGKLVPKWTVNSKAADTLVAAFTNIYAPEVDNVTVDFEIDKTYIDKLTKEELDPKDFEFVITKDGTAITPNLVTDEKGFAKYTAIFTTDDIGKTFKFTVSELAGDNANITYSKVTYAVEVEITLKKDDTLKASVKLDGKDVNAVKAVFVNEYEAINPPETGDNGLTPWLVLLIVSALGMALLIFFDKKRRKA